MKAIVLNDFYEIRKNLLSNIFILTFSMSYFWIDMYKNGINVSNCIVPGFLVQMIFSIMVGGIVLSNINEKSVEYLRATPTTEEDYVKTKFLLQFIIAGSILLIEILIVKIFTTDDVTFNMILLSGALNYLIGIFYIFSAIKFKNSISTVGPVIIFAVIFVFVGGAIYPDILINISKSSLIFPLAIIFLIIDVVMHLTLKKLSIRELKIYE